MAGYGSKGRGALASTFGPSAMEGPPSLECSCSMAADVLTHAGYEGRPLRCLSDNQQQLKDQYQHARLGASSPQDTCKPTAQHAAQASGLTSSKANSRWWHTHTRPTGAPPSAAVAASGSGVLSGAAGSGVSCKPPGLHCADPTGSWQCAADIGRNPGIAVDVPQAVLAVRPASPHPPPVPDLLTASQPIAWQLPLDEDELLGITCSSSKSTNSSDASCSSSPTAGEGRGTDGRTHGFKGSNSSNRSLSPPTTPSLSCPPPPPPPRRPTAQPAASSGHQRSGSAAAILSSAAAGKADGAAAAAPPPRSSSPGLGGKPSLARGPPPAWPFAGLGQGMGGGGRHMPPPMMVPVMGPHMLPVMPPGMAPYPMPMMVPMPVMVPMAGGPHGPMILPPPQHPMMLPGFRGGPPTPHFIGMGLPRRTAGPQPSKRLEIKDPSKAPAPATATPITTSSSRAAAALAGTKSSSRNNSSPAR